MSFTQYILHVSISGMREKSSKNLHMTRRGLNGIPVYIVQKQKTSLLKNGTNMTKAFRIKQECRMKAGKIGRKMGSYQEQPENQNKWKQLWSNLEIPRFKGMLDTKRTHKMQAGRLGNLMVRSVAVTMRQPK